MWENEASFLRALRVPEYFPFNKPYIYIYIYIKRLLFLQWFWFSKVLSFYWAKRCVWLRMIIKWRERLRGERRRERERESMFQNLLPQIKLISIRKENWVLTCHEMDRKERQLELLMKWIAWDHFTCHEIPTVLEIYIYIYISFFCDW